MQLVVALIRNLNRVCMCLAFMHVALQLNIDRAVQRRAPIHVQNMQMPFDHDKFNFNKIPSEEIICYLRSNQQDSVSFL